eukprot:scaffold20882_cov71-Phaeocystis_antarctica.AAC.12
MIHLETPRGRADRATRCSLRLGTTCIRLASKLVARASSASIVRRALTGHVNATAQKGTFAIVTNPHLPQQAVARHHPKRLIRQAQCAALLAEKPNRAVGTDCWALAAITVHAGAALARQFPYPWSCWQHPSRRATTQPQQHTAHITQSAWPHDLAAVQLHGPGTGAERVACVGRKEVGVTIQADCSPTALRKEDGNTAAPHCVPLRGSRRRIAMWAQAKVRQTHAARVGHNASVE